MSVLPVGHLDGSHAVWRVGIRRGLLSAGAAAVLTGRPEAGARGGLYWANDDGGGVLRSAGGNWVLAADGGHVQGGRAGGA